MTRRDELEQRTIRETFTALTVDDLKALAPLVSESPIRKSDLPTKKGELVDLLAGFMEDREKVRALYARLSEAVQKVLQEATHDPQGILYTGKFEAKYGHRPSFGGSGRRYYTKADPPSKLRLFFPQFTVLASDLQELLQTFVPEPPALKVDASNELPATVRASRRDETVYGRRSIEQVEIELRVRQTARTALHDLKAVCRLIDAGEVRVGEKTLRPAQGSMKAIRDVLAEGDFYTEADQSRDDYDPDSDLHIQAFAWPMLLQAAGLAQAAGTRLQLTPAGRKATARPAHEVIRQVWQKWQKTTLIDEFNRIDVIKGQKSQGRGLTAVAGRRSAVLEVLEECPTEKWIAIDELFRLLKVIPTDFALSHDPWKLYISELQYGSFGNGHRTWDLLEGRFVLAFLLEYAATLGLLDVAYLPPAGVRDDYQGRWGTDDLSCLSRYDGLIYVRINPLGAWCLGLAEQYEPPAIPHERLFQVLPNYDVVAADQTPSPADVLFLERFASRTSDAVWRLEAGKILEAVEKGMAVAELQEFLAAKSLPPLPQTVDVFLNDLVHKAGQLTDQGTARLIACADAHVAQVLAHDRRLRALCQLAGERQLVFRASDEATVRRALRELGYVLPPPR